MSTAERIDITGNICPLYPEWQDKSDDPWPMYSYDRPAYMVWNEIANVMHERGWSDAKIKEWLQSKKPRWSLDGSLGDALTEAARKWAMEKIED